MRVSLINFNLVAKDAIGNCMIVQARFFLNRGDIVHIFTEQPPEGIPADIVPLCRTVSLAQLRQDCDGILAATDVYIYHYGLRHSLMETITQFDGGLVIFYYHNVTPPELWNRDEDQEFLRRGVAGVKLAAYADLVLSDSDYNLTELAKRVELAPERLVKVPLPVDMHTFHPGPAAQDLRYKYSLGDRPVLLYVGRMAPNKRIDLLVELLAAVRQHATHPQPEARLLLVGDADSSPAYRLEIARARARARELAVDDYVIIAGRSGRLSDHYRLASVYVTTSQHEGFCMPLIEAMASGVPIVAAASTAIPETLGDAGILAPVDALGVVSVTEMADAVAHVLSVPDLAGDLRQRGLARASDYSSARYNERLEVIIDEYCTNLPLRVQPVLNIQVPERVSDESEVVSATKPEEMEIQDAVEFVEEEAYGGTLSWPELVAEAHIAMPEYTIRSKLPIIGGLVAWVRRNLTSHLKEPYLDPIILRQQAYNLELTRRFVQLSQQIKPLPDLQAQIAKQGLLGEEMKARLQELAEGLSASQERLAGVRADLLRAESHIARLEGQLTREDVRRVFSFSSGQSDMDSLDVAPQQAYGINYLRCNEVVGGDLEVETALYEPFVQMFQGHVGPVLDLGCGRGVFLQIMRRHGISAVGADVDGNMVAYCRERGLMANEGDVFEYLRRQADASLGGIFCAHVIEHIPRTRLMELADLCWRKLEGGGLVVWITPHGGSLAPLHATFYKDVTHTRPLHPDLLAFILEANGFRQVETRTLSDMPEDLKLQLLPDNDIDEFSRVLNRNFDRLNDLIFGHLDCAAIGWR
jgi:glycosyltransferase involved in cell wall biosynthesis/2-polyprenyl-3-methyl-5-hydroxy-6-metoxy-1,4-benzoquinol methylase